MHPVTGVFISFWFAVPMFLVGVGVGSRRIGLVVLPWAGVWGAAKLFAGAVPWRVWPPEPLSGLVMVASAMALAFWLGWQAGAGRWITEAPWGRSQGAPSVMPKVVLAILLAGFCAGIFAGLRDRPALAEENRTPAVDGPARPGGIDDRTDLLTPEAREHAEHYIRLLAGREISFRIVTGSRMPDAAVVPGRRGVLLEAAGRPVAVRLSVGSELAAFLTPAQCAALAAGTRRELSAGNPVGAFWDTSAQLWGIFAEGQRPPGSLSESQRTSRRTREARGAGFQSVVASIFMLGLGCLLGASGAAHNLLWAAPAGAFCVVLPAFFLPGWLELRLWVPSVAPVLAVILGAGAGLVLVRRNPGWLRPDPPQRRWSWGVRFGGFRGSRGGSGRGSGIFGGGRSGGGGASGRA